MKTSAEPKKKPAAEAGNGGVESEGSAISGVSCGCLTSMAYRPGDRDGDLEPERPSSADGAMESRSRFAIDRRAARKDLGCVDDGCSRACGAAAGAGAHVGGGSHRRGAKPFDARRSTIASSSPAASSGLIFSISGRPALGVLGGPIAFEAIGHVDVDRDAVLGDREAAIARDHWLDKPALNELADGPLRRLCAHFTARPASTDVPALQADEPFLRSRQAGEVVGHLGSLLRRIEDFENRQPKGFGELRRVVDSRSGAVFVAGDRRLVFADRVSELLLGQAEAFTGFADGC